MKNAVKWQAISKRIPWDFIPEDLGVSENLDKTWQNPNWQCIGKVGSLEIYWSSSTSWKHDSILVVEIWGKWWCSGFMWIWWHPDFEKLPISVVDPWRRPVTDRRLMKRRESHDCHIGEPFLPHRLLQSHGGWQLATSMGQVCGIES
jgi:hypothetical protein